VGDRIPFETNLGAMDLAQYLGSFGSAGLRYVSSPQEFAHVAPLASAQGVCVINASYTYDTKFLEAFAASRQVQAVLLDVSQLRMFIRSAGDEAARFRDVLRAAQPLFGELGVEVDVGRFAPAELPAFLVTDVAQLRERARATLQDATALQRMLLKNLPAVRVQEPTRFVLNIDNDLVRALPECEDAPTVARAVRLLYAQAALTLRRTLSLPESRLFSQDLLALIARGMPRPSGGYLN
jgi:molecular chaperone HtpG